MKETTKNKLKIGGAVGGLLLGAASIVGIVSVQNESKERKAAVEALVKADAKAEEERAHRALVAKLKAKEAEAKAEEAKADKPVSLADAVRSNAFFSRTRPGQRPSRGVSHEQKLGQALGASAYAASKQAGPSSPSGQVRVSFDYVSGLSEERAALPAPVRLNPSDIVPHSGDVREKAFTRQNDRGLKEAEASASGVGATYSGEAGPQEWNCPAGVPEEVLKHAQVGEQGAATLRGYKCKLGSASGPSN